MRAMAVYAALGGVEMVWSAMLVMSVSREKIWQMVSPDVLVGVAVGRGVVVLVSGALSPSVEISVAFCSGVFSDVSIFPFCEKEKSTSWPS